MQTMINKDFLAGKRIAVLLSGGVDSSVVLCLLAREGLHPDCFYIRIGPEEEEGDWDCSAEEDMEMATAVARKYGCRLEVVDCHHEYWDQVTTYTMEKVRAGLTPNPDVMCNRLIKFGAFHEKRGHDYDLIATGHYATTEIEVLGDGCWVLGKSQEPRANTQHPTPSTQHPTPNTQHPTPNTQHPTPNTQHLTPNTQHLTPNTQHLKWLCTSPDPVKDQTDFLAQLYGWQLEKALFPIGHLMKDEVRRIAEEEHLVNARRRDSQGICFLGKIDYTEYLRRYLGEQPGDVLELETGRLIGRHRGHWFYTIGQRKGLGFGGGPWFVVAKDVEQNLLYVSNGYDPATAYRSDFPIHGFHSINGQLPGEDVTFKIRHTPEFHCARLEPAGEGRYTVHSEVKIHGVAPGQFCVIYDALHHRCYGSAEIAM